jgi:hypothetical protein
LIATAYWEPRARNRRTFRSCAPIVGTRLGLDGDVGRNRPEAVLRFGSDLRFDAGLTNPGSVGAIHAQARTDGERLAAFGTAYRGSRAHDYGAVFLPLETITGVGARNAHEVEVGNEGRLQVKGHLRRPFAPSGDC